MSRSSAGAPLDATHTEHVQVAAVDPLGSALGEAVKIIHAPLEFLEANPLFFLRCPRHEAQSSAALLTWSQRYEPPRVLWRLQTLRGWSQRMNEAVAGAADEST